MTLSTPAQQPQRIGEPDRQRAEEIAQTLAAQTKLADKEKGLDPAEEEKLKQLEESVKETVEKLRALDNETQRDVLAELEEKAHQAEQLADELDSTVEETLSSKMLEELARHADTTDFASALQAKDLQQASDESKELAKRLDDKDLSREVQKRIEHALDSALDVASEDDKKGLVGKHLKQADQDLKQDQPKKAAEKFQRLSKQLNRAKQRELAKQQLEQLARALRNSGQQIFGRDTSEIRRLAQDASIQQGMQQLGAQQLQEMGNLQLGQRMAAAQQGQQGQLGQGMILTPAPPGQQNPNGLVRRRSPAPVRHGDRKHADSRCRKRSDPGCRAVPDPGKRDVSGQGYGDRAKVPVRESLPGWQWARGLVTEDIAPAMARQLTATRRPIRWRPREPGSSTPRFPAQARPRCASDARTASGGNVPQLTGYGNRVHQDRRRGPGRRAAAAFAAPAGPSILHRLKETAR